MVGAFLGCAGLVEADATHHVVAFGNGDPGQGEGAVRVVFAGRLVEIALGIEIGFGVEVGVTRLAFGAFAFHLGTLVFGLAVAIDDHRHASALAAEAGVGTVAGVAGFAVGQVRPGILGVAGITLLAGVIRLQFKRRITAACDLAGLAVKGALAAVIGLTTVDGAGEGVAQAAKLAFLLPNAAVAAGFVAAQFGAVFEQEGLAAIRADPAIGAEQGEEDRELTV